MNAPHSTIPAQRCPCLGGGKLIRVLCLGYDDNGKRLVAGVVPVTEDRKQVLLIQSTRRKGWVLPKGGWETDEMVIEAAKREAWEEAGIEVRIDYDLGRIEDNRKVKDKADKSDKSGKSSKSEKHDDKNDKCDKQDECEVDKKDSRAIGDDTCRSIMHFFEAVVLQEHPVWPEAHKRERRWMSFEKAMEELKDRPELQCALRSSTLKRVAR